MNWDDCRYCKNGRMITTGKTRAAPHNPAITQIAHKCDSCTNHADTVLWVPERKAIPTPKAFYGDFKHYRDDPEYKLAHASAQAAAGER